MTFSVEDRFFIKNLYKYKAYGTRKLMREFPEKGCDCLNILILFSYFICILT